MGVLLCRLGLHAFHPSLSMPGLAICARGCCAVKSMRPAFRRIVR